MSLCFAELQRGHVALRFLSSAGPSVTQHRLAPSCPAHARAPSRHDVMQCGLRVLLGGEHYQRCGVMRLQWQQVPDALIAMESRVAGSPRRRRCGMMTMGLLKRENPRPAYFE